MANYMLPVNTATQAQLIKRQRVIKQCSPVSAIDVLTDEHASLPVVNEKPRDPTNKRQKRRLQKKKKSKPAFYRYSEKQELEQDDNLVYDDLEHVNVAMDHEEHKGSRLDISC
jgi:hypothetical protein